MKKNQGQVIIEYILILSISSVGVLNLSKAISNAMTQGVQGLANRLESDLKTGQISNGMWQ